MEIQNVISKTYSIAQYVHVADASLCQEVSLCQIQVRNMYFSRGLWLIYFCQAIGRQWKQWCSDHKEGKSPPDVVSSYCRAAINFLDILHISKRLSWIS